MVAQRDGVQQAFGAKADIGDVRAGLRFHHEQHVSPRAHNAAKPDARGEAGDGKANGFEDSGKEGVLLMAVAAAAGVDELGGEAGKVEPNRAAQNAIDVLEGDVGGVGEVEAPQSFEGGGEGAGVFNAGFVGSRIQTLVSSGWMAVGIHIAWMGLVLSGAMYGTETLDARALLAEISAAERSTDGWHAEGVEINELTGEGMNFRTQHRFSATVKDAARLRWEMVGETSTLTVCDGTEHWSYTQPGIGFHISPVEATPCPTPLPRFESLIDNLTTVTAMGTDATQFEGGSSGCTIIRAEYRIPAASHGATPGAGGIGSSMIRTMCIEVARKLVLRDKAESWNTGSNARSTRTTTFSEYERSADRVANAFTFEVPTGTFLDPGPQSGENTAATNDGSHRFGDGVISPVLIVKASPTATDEARAAGVGGLVLVSLTVDAEGHAKDVAVERRLGYGLDEKAVEAVSQWRFKPGISFGMPVVVRELVVAVDFPRQ